MENNSTTANATAMKRLVTYTDKPRRERQAHMRRVEASQKATEDEEIAHGATDYWMDSTNATVIVRTIFSHRSQNRSFS
jgi:hypothetical protein